MQRKNTFGFYIYGSHLLVLDERSVRREVDMERLITTSFFSLMRFTEKAFCQKRRKFPTLRQLKKRGTVDITIKNSGSRRGRIQLDDKQGPRPAICPKIAFGENVKELKKGTEVYIVAMIGETYIVRPVPAN